MNQGYELMMKCDMCYDRTSLGKKPMCATVCPSDALYFGKRDEIERIRQEKPVNEFQFGMQTVKTKVNMMTSQEAENVPVDISDFMAGSTFQLPESRCGAPDAAMNAVFELPEIVKLAKNQSVEELEV